MPLWAHLLHFIPVGQIGTCALHPTAWLHGATAKSVVTDHLAAAACLWWVRRSWRLCRSGLRRGGRRRHVARLGRPCCRLGYWRWRGLRLCLLGVLGIELGELRARVVGILPNAVGVEESLPRVFRADLASELIVTANFGRRIEGWDGNRRARGPG